MIVVKLKPIKKIVDMIGSADDVLIVGCDGCVGIYQEGGQKQVDLMKILLKMAKRLDEKRVLNVRTAVVLRQCDRQMCATSLLPLIDKNNVILSMACGEGVQTLAEVFKDNLVVPAHDTMFIGTQDRELGKFYELCKACGDCILFETGGVCPVTRCAKGLMNGPCGGCVEGKCEVSAEVRDEFGKVTETREQDCAWYLIYNKLKKEGRLDLFRKYSFPKNRAISNSPRQL